MALSLFLAKVMGSYFLIAGLAFLTQRHVFAEVSGEMSKHFYLAYILSFFVMILGLMIVFGHNIWVADWRVLITIIGWITLLKRSLLDIFFDSCQKVTDLVAKSHSFL